MRVVIAKMFHETNTFSPVPTPFERFRQRVGLFGQAVVDHYGGTNTAIGAYLDLARSIGADIVTPVAAEAPPSAAVELAAYRLMTDAIFEAVDRGCDALLLDLHGAMVTEASDDGDGDLLAELRRRHPALPITVALDMHANVTAAMVSSCDIIVGYRTYPHVDVRRTGERAGRLLLDKIEGKIAPRMAWGRRPMLPHTLKMATADEPMKSLMAMAQQSETGRILATSVFGGFPMVDIPEPGLSVVCVVDGARDEAERTVGAILDAAWLRRSAFVYHTEPLEKSVARAKQCTEGPVILVDHGDNVASGGTEDTMEIVREVLRQGITDAAMFAVHDPASVARLIEAGVGAEVTLPLGGKVDMPSIGRKGEPLPVTGRVRTISDGRFTVTGPLFTGFKVDMGKSILFETAGLQIAVISKHVEPWDLGNLRVLGVEPTQKRFIILKSRIMFGAAYRPIAKAVIECGTAGVCSSDYELFRFTKIRRPIYPLDLDMAL
ncbi:MAG: M81 family metallopeptidase [Pseudomonadota bacterium]